METNQKHQRILWAVKIGDEDWQEQLITEQDSQIENALAWAKTNGFDRFRISTFTNGEMPDFRSTLNR